MRHRKSVVKLSRTASHRDAMFRNMVTSLFEYGKVTTTVVKAKALKPLADKMVGLAKKGDLAAIRHASSILMSKKTLANLFKTAKTNFADRNSGYTSIIKIGPRKGDAAPMAIVELIQPGYLKAAVGGGDAAKVKPVSSSSDRSKRVAQSKKAVEQASEESNDSKE